MTLKSLAKAGLMLAVLACATLARAEEKRAVLPDFPIIMCQHRNAGTQMLQEIRENARHVDVLMPMWFEVLESGEVKALSGCEGPFETYVKEAHTLGIKVMPIVRNFAPRKLLADPEHISRMVQETAAMIRRESFDGVLVDLEELQNADRDPLVALTRQLRKHPSMSGKLISVAVPKNPLHDHVDYQKLAVESDFLFVMFYDYVGPWNKVLGPTAPMTWPAKKGDIERDFANILAAGVPREKVLFGVPVYGNDFTLDSATREVVRVRALYLDNIAELQRKHGAQAQNDPVTRSVYFNYTSENGEMHQVWFEDERTLKEKVEFARRNQLFGMGVWAAVYPSQPVGGNFWQVVSQVRPARK